MTMVSVAPSRLQAPFDIFFAHGQRPLRIGAVILLMLLLIGSIGPFLLPDQNMPSGGLSLQPPGWEHPFGTDRYGRDVLARVVGAIHLDLTMGIGVAIGAMLLGTVLGAVAGYFGGAVDEIVMRITDALLAFPGFVLALMIAEFMGHNALFMAIGITISLMPQFVRLTRARTLSERELEYVAAARISGAGDEHIVVGHIIPNTIAAPLIHTTVAAGWAILDIAALSFLGVGIQPPTPEWGTMISEGYSDILSGSWWPAFFPGLFLTLAALSFQLVGDGLARWFRR
jgi:peptide/nickel transport system permease protein